MKSTAIILAAGSGRRFGADQNKLFIDILGEPLISHTIRAFDQCDLVNELVLVCDVVDQIIPLLSQFNKPIKTAQGGAERFDSVWNGLKSIESADIVSIHDGARCLVTPDIISKSIQDAHHFGSGVVAARMTDTVKKVDDTLTVVSTLNRDQLFSIQTPQSFRFDLVYSAYQKGISSGFKGTDDASFVEHAGFDVRITEGPTSNIKVTYNDDVDIVISRLRRR